MGIRATIKAEGIAKKITSERYFESQYALRSRPDTLI